jgi:hypothetical protein
MKGVRRVLALVAVAFVSLQLSQAQDNVNTAELKAFLSELYGSTFTQLSNNGSADLEGAMEKFEAGYSGQKVQVGYDGNVTVNPETIVELRKSLREYTELGAGVRVTFRTGTFNSVYVKEKVGVASFSVDYEVTKDGESISKGEQLYSVTARKFFDGTWKVSYSNCIEVEAERFVGDCICEIFGSDNSYMTSLTVPDGNRVETAVDRFEIVTTTDRRVIKMNGDNIFDWNKSNGDISMDGKNLGKGGTSEVAMMLILKRMNAEQCQRVRKK